MIGRLLCKIFSAQCQLKTFRLDISNVFKSGSIYECFESNSYLSSNSIQQELQSYCVTLRYLYIRLNRTYFLENLIEHVPNLEQLSVEFHYLLKFGSFETSNIETLKQSNENWFNKVRKLTFLVLFL